MNLGSRLEEILKDRGMTVTQLAREAEVSPQTLYAMIRRDSNKVDMNIMARILQAPQMELAEFVELAGREAPAGRKQQAAAGAEEKTAKEEEREETTEKRSGRREMETYLL